MDIKNTKQELLNKIVELESSLTEMSNLKDQISFKDKLINQLQAKNDSTIQAKQNDENIKRLTEDYEGKLKKYDEAYKKLADSTNRIIRSYESTLKILQGLGELSIDLEGYEINSLKGE